MTDRQPSSRYDWDRIAYWLVGTTLLYNIVEAVVALWAGERASSVALVGFGFDSLIEVVAASAMLWRLRGGTGGTAAAVAIREHRVHSLVGATFLFLAAYVLAYAGWTLVRREPPSHSQVGMYLAGLSLALMPAVAAAKLRAAREIGSRALRAEAKETLACSYLSFTLLLGLAANARFGLWWADPVAALLMIPWLVKEGLEGLRSEGGCCQPEG